MESVKEENLLFANSNALIGAAKDARGKKLEASAQKLWNNMVLHQKGR